jgi:phosphatidylglycerophosphate synthase
MLAPPMTWVLVLDRASGDPTLRIAGLPLSLRLALDAQQGGASAVVVSPEAAAARPALSDARLRLPVLDQAPEGARRVHVPASFVVHRGLFRKIATQDEQSPSPPPVRDLAREPVAHGARWGFDPIDVSDAKSRRAAERALFRALRKPEDGWTSRYLNRYISLFLSRWLVKTTLHPNQISVGILAFGVAGAVFAAQGTELGLVLGAAMLQTQSVLDGCDGEMSRITYRGSRTGEWLDTIGDDLSNYGYFAGAAWGSYRLSGSSLYLVAGAVILFSGLLSSGLEYRYLIKIGSGDLLKYPLSQSQSQSSGFFAQLTPLFKRDTFVLLTLLAAIAGFVGPMLLVFSLGALGILISVLLTERRLAREGLP